MEKFHENHINKMHVLHLTKNNFSSKTDKTDYPLVPVAQTSYVDPALSMQPSNLQLKGYNAHGTTKPTNL